MDIVIEKIRKTNGNLKLIREMDSICFPDNPPLLLGLRKVFCWMGKDDHSNIVGYACAYKKNDYFYLSRMGILPEYRGHGLQKQFIETRLEKARDLKLKGAITYTSNENIASIRNLEKCGFRKWTTCPKWFGKGDDYIEWINSPSL